MAISNNPLLHGIRGSLNKQFVIRQLNGKTIISGYPDMSTQKFSPAQKAVQQRMKKANKAAKAIMKDEKLRDLAQVRLNVQRNKLYHALIKEYFSKTR